MKYSPNVNDVFASEQDFTRDLTAHRADQECERAGVPLLVRSQTIYTDDSDNHTLIFGNTGSKKTRNFCIPTVYALGNAGESMVISDPKGEIYNYTSGFLKQQGYEICTFNLRDMNRSSKWNPLYIPFMYFKNGVCDRAMEMITDFANILKMDVHHRDDVFWENQAAELLIGLIYALFECETNPAKINMKSVLTMRGYIELEGSRDDGTNVFWDFVRTFQPGSFVRTKLASVYSLRNTEKTLNSVLATFDTMCRAFTINQQLMSMISASEIDFEQALRKKTVLYLITPDEKTTFHFLVSIFVKQFYEYTISKAQQFPECRLPNRLNFILDEFSNFPKISDMPAMISAARSRNIRFMLIVQSKQQLTSMYEDDAETIKSNCKNWIYLACRELALLREISELCGTVTDHRGAAVPAISVTQLQHLTIGWIDSQALILRANCLPYLSSVKDFSVFSQSKIPPAVMPESSDTKIRFFSLPSYMISLLKKSSEDQLADLFDLS
ncbi:MAG: type IV secretory system conjugative DNA transfer family protein [Oscillospiraceae bacterium]|nr:type IV secretory system conjugative DNA transfer family protein [Oscillospiraceae bacterium]